MTPYIVCFRIFGTYSILNKRKLIAIEKTVPMGISLYMYCSLLRIFIKTNVQGILFTPLRVHVLTSHPKGFTLIISFVFAVPNFVIHTVYAISIVC